MYDRRMAELSVNIIREQLVIVNAGPDTVILTAVRCPEHQDAIVGGEDNFPESGIRRLPGESWRLGLALSLGVPPTIAFDVDWTDDTGPRTDTFYTKS